MKTRAGLTILLMSLSLLASARQYPDTLNEFGMNMGLLNRFHSNIEQGKSESGQLIYRLAFDYQNRYSNIFMAVNQSFEFGGMEKFLINSSLGGGVAIWKNKTCRLDLSFLGGLDFSQSFMLKFKPTLSVNAAIHFENVRISYTGRTAIGWEYGFSENGITVGILLRTKEFKWQ